jgi:hypothetical protein
MLPTFLPYYLTLVLMALYAKNEKADLTPLDKKALAATLKEIMASWRRK